MWKTLLGPALVLISAGIAIVGIRNARSIARQKATLDIIEKFESTDHYRSRNEAFSAVRKSGGFAALHNPATDALKTVRGQVQDYINHYELIAIGIRSNILDERIYRNWMGSAVVRDWNAAAAYVQNERWRLNEAREDYIYHAKLYENYQWLACRFAPSAIKLTQHSSPKPLLSAAAGPGDDPLPAETVTEPQATAFTSDRSAKLTVGRPLGPAIAMIASITLFGLANRRRGGR